MRNAIVLALAFVATLAAAQKTSTVGLGASSCGSYNEFRAKGDEESRMMAGFYLQGYLSGINAGMLANQRQTKSIPDGAALLSFVDSYCRRNPLERVDAALIALYMQLR
ncbi:MAG: hypothetical protein KGZ75_04870 [Syntrophomonadaceae bacterium]|nr:hypothetical protein [Syntrophomonadaceae bacterium]